MAKKKPVQWQSKIVGHDRVPAGQLLANPFNHRRHPQAQRDVVAASINELGFIKSVIVNRTTGHIVDGHERVMQALGVSDETLVDVEYVELSPDDEKKALLILDASGDLAEVDADKAKHLLDVCDFDLPVIDKLFESLGISNLVDEKDLHERTSLAQRFGFIPFTVLDSEQDWWIERREYWDSVGNVSTIDPVLCEILYRWFAPKNGSVSGGSQCVAEHLGYAFEKNEQCDFYLFDPCQSEKVKSSLAQDRFAACVSNGCFSDAVNDAKPMHYYNEFVVVRDGKGEKDAFARCHLTVMVFVNGDPAKATKAINANDAELMLEGTEGSEFGDVYVD